MEAFYHGGPKYGEELPAYATTYTTPFIPAPPAYSTLAPALRSRPSTLSLHESTPIDPDSQRPTPLPSSLTAFDITLDNPKLCFRGIDSSPTSRNAADELDTFQRDCAARLTGSLHLCVAPDSPFSSHAPNTHTLTSISLRIRGTERTSPRGSNAYGYRTILDSRVTLWERNSTASSDSEAANDDNAAERMMQFRLTIPPHCPPTYKSKYGDVEYHVDAVLQRVGNLPDVVVRAPFTITRAPTKLELNRWATGAAAAATTTTDCSHTHHPRWSTPSDGVVDIAKLGLAIRYIAVPAARGTMTVVSAQLEQTATYCGRAAPLLRRPRPTSWTRSTRVAAIEVESVRHHGGASFAIVGLRFPAEPSPQLMQDATGGLITVQHDIVLRLRDLASGKSREARLGIKVVPSY
ncbi:hypothetical protein HDU87_006500 [Geranomyces variabilis]|uniref:Arrestin-like N-terminal domain-containing protein n=1 Tax=Geranomyces variabilis TaxID=109894 RepID=A0AAD5THQ4_9FUNG|nr:hypothetical protein HDU87_006500 [Geranomyces variabilis]